GGLNLELLGSRTALEEICCWLGGGRASEPDTIQRPLSERSRQARWRLGPIHRYPDNLVALQLDALDVGIERCRLVVDLGADLHVETSDGAAGVDSVNLGQKRGVNLKTSGDDCGGGNTELTPRSCCQPEIFGDRGTMDAGCGNQPA